MEKVIQIPFKEKSIDECEAIIKNIKKGQFFSIKTKKQLESKVEGLPIIKETMMVCRLVDNIPDFQASGKGISWADKIDDRLYQHKKTKRLYLMVEPNRHNKTSKSIYIYNGEEISKEEAKEKVKRKSDFGYNSKNEMLFALLPLDNIIEIKF